MPADYQSAAQALAVSPSPSPPPNPPPWSRRLSTSSRRNQYSSRSRVLISNAWASLEGFSNQMMSTYRRLSPVQKVLAVASITTGYVIIILGVIYSGRVFEWLAGVSKSWREMPAGWLIVFFLIFATSFPPIMGYSTANTIAGFVYGWKGWFISVAACTIGSLCSFIACRTVLSRYVDRMVGHDPRFVALGQVLRRDGILYLTGIRFCPLPFSLSNGFLATIPSITPSAFALSTFLASPKLMVHVFIGSRLAVLAESGDKMSLGDKVVNWIGMAIGGAVGIAVGWIVYKRTMARAAEIARQDAALEEGQPEGRDDGYMDREDTLLDPDDAAAIMSDDDLSLWETQIADDDEEESDEEGRKKGASQGDVSTGRS